MCRGCKKRESCYPLSTDLRERLLWAFRLARGAGLLFCLYRLDDLGCRRDLFLYISLLGGIGIGTALSGRG